MINPYIGSTVLELSKLHMYKFYYDVLKPSHTERHQHSLYGHG